MANNTPPPTSSGLVVPVRYRFDLPTLVTGLKPYLLRKPVLRAFLLAVTSPVAWLYARFVSYEASTRRQLSYSGQKLAFERALNDGFDPAFQRIRIQNADEQVEPSFDFYVAENHQPPGFMWYVQENHQPAEYDFYFSEIVNQVGFVVLVPTSLSTQDVAINALIRRYKLAMVKYKIQYV